MSNIFEIAKVPTCLKREMMQKLVDSGCSGAHESVLRSYQLLQKVTHWLKEGMPGPLVLELLSEMEAADGQDAE